MAHSLETTIREAYAAFRRGDLDGYLRACTEDFTFTVPGDNSMAGTYAGRDGLNELAAKVMAITAGTFEEELEDVLANDAHAVVLTIHRLTRDGAVRSYRTAHVYDVHGGKLARCYEQPRDPDAFDDAWGRAIGPH